MEFHYKGFYGKAHFSADTLLFYGEIINCKHLIAYQAQTPKEVKYVLESAIDYYLEHTLRRHI